MLQGYFDDSGNTDKSFAFVLAGYILESEAMAAFADDWVTALHDHPRIDYFKMNEAFLGRGQFINMATDVKARVDKVMKLIAVIHKHHPTGIATFMNWEHFKFFARYLPEPLQKQAFAPLFFTLIDIVLLYQKSAGIFPNKVQLDFDNQSEAGEFAIHWYGVLKNNPPPLCFSPEHLAVVEGTPRMLDDKGYVILQAADMAAWFTRNSGTPDIEIGGWEEAYHQCLATIWPHCHGFAEQTFEQILDNVIGPRMVRLT